MPCGSKHPSDVRAIRQVHRLRPVSHHKARTLSARAPEPADDLTRFERLLLDISTVFINRAAGRFDDAIVGALRRIVETLEIDRSTLNVMSTARGRIEVAYSYARPGVDQLPHMASGPESWPWAWSLLMANRPVVFASLDELPQEASIDRLNWARIGLKSHVTMPLRVNGRVLGGLSFGAVRRQRAWPDDLVAQMRRVAGTFEHVLDHMFAQEELDRALEFERLASRILASIFLERPGAEGDVISQGLRDIGQFLRVEWVSLWERIPQRAAFRPTHDWPSPGIAPSAAAECARDPWLSERLVSGAVANVGHAIGGQTQANGALPKLPGGTHTLLAVPIGIAGRVSGALVLGSAHEDRAWPDAIVPGVRLIAEAFASLAVRLSAERKKEAAEVEAAQWREKLAHLVRVHTAGEMSAALAHEITQPLGAIENYALAARRRMSDETPDPHRVRELIDKVIGQATRAGDVVTRMRGMVQRHELEPGEIDLARAVRDCVEMVKLDCEVGGIRIEVRPAERLPTAYADEIHVQQVILNLLRNAMDAVQTLPSDAAKAIAIDVGLDDQGIFVEVADRGPGIATADLERVFESFYSTKPKGLGIGLAICRRLIEAHGGTLRAAHNPGGGASFRMTLPLTPALP
ncbi:MAG: GAF domain-containing sensor histidine kinase [Burkholderiales bacterium]